MRALCWRGKKDVAVERVPDPKIINPRDAIVRVTSTAICGSDLHLYNGYIPTMEKGDILGHEFMGEVVDVAPGVTNLMPGDRVVVPFPIACGACAMCQAELYSCCENSLARQCSQRPHEMGKGTTTRSPFFRLGTPGPTSSTTPMNS